MNPLDIGVIAVIGLSAVFAFARGFVREALSIVAWVGAALITLYGYRYVFATAESLVHSPLLSEVVAIGATFIVSLIVLTIATSLIARSVRASALSAIDRSLGFVFGVARGVVLVSLAYLLLDMSVGRSDWPQWMQSAKSTPYLAEGAQVLRSVLPPGLKIDGTAGAATGGASAAEIAARVVWVLTTPKTPLPPNEAELPRYPSGDRREMNRLVGTQRQ